MSGIFNGIQTLVSTIQSIINGIKIGIQFLINLVTSIVKVIELLITTIGNVNSIILTLPDWLIAFASVSVAVAVLYLIVGRETGK